jgi:predicted ferric reductase
MAFFIASGPFPFMSMGESVSALGRMLGILATVLLLIQVMLAARAPFVERALGHDRALALHSSIGQPAMLLLLAHGVLLTVGWAWMLDRGILEQYVRFFQSQWIMLSIVAVGVLGVVAITSVAAVRKQWRYETWHAIHIAAYVGVGLSVPHQFFDGSTFVASSAAAWIWAAGYVVAFGSLLTWRVAVPMWRAWRHRMVVQHIRRDDDGTVTITMTGALMDEWGAQPGQFLLWRFWTKGMWATAHPYSLSAAPDGQSLRITVASLGDHSTLVRAIEPGTRVTASGPYGLFTHEARTAHHLVLAAAGVGVTPVRAMLEDPEVVLGECDVILRAHSERDMPLLEEITILAQAKGARVHTLWGPRGRGWTPANDRVELIDLVPHIADADLFVCGPVKWADALETEALSLGVPQDAIHREAYGW